MTGLYRRTYRILGIMILLCGISMLIPIPGTNTMPAIGVFVIALSMIEEDSLAGVAGALIALSGIAVTVLILFFGKEALTLLWETYIK